METTTIITPHREQIQSHRYEPRHRETAGLAMRAKRVAAAAGRVLGRGHTLNINAPHPNAHHVQPVRHEAYKSGELRYDAATSARLVGAGNLVLTNRQPILSRDQVQEQLGLRFGNLQAVIHMASDGAPNPDTTLYCFDQ